MHKPTLSMVVSACWWVHGSMNELAQLETRVGAWLEVQAVQVALGVQGLLA